MSDSPILVACPHCGAMNRLPRPRLGEAPNCGRCHRAVFVGKPLVLTSGDFDTHAVRSELPVVVDGNLQEEAWMAARVRWADESRACASSVA